MNTDEVLALGVELSAAREQLTSALHRHEGISGEYWDSQDFVDRSMAKCAELEQQLHEAILRQHHIDPRDQAL